jgi:TRAP transporter TAXI family solute receptor
MNWRRLFLSALLCVLVASGPLAALAADLGIITGSEKGTYYQFGLNLQALGRTNGFSVTVHPSKGSVENIFAVYQRPGVPLGIVQSDVLAFVARVQTDQTLMRIAKKIKLVYPLYNEEIHLLARRGVVTTFDDLADKRVAIGREGSGTYLTTRRLFKLSEVTPREMLLIDTDEALAALKAGKIDAMFFVAGVPVRLLTEGVARTDELALVPITDKDIGEFYPRATIAGGVYGWQPGTMRSRAGAQLPQSCTGWSYRGRRIPPGSSPRVTSPASATPGPVEATSRGWVWAMIDPPC